MILTPIDLETRLTDYAQAFSEMTAENFTARLSPLFSQNARFKDPFNDVNGLPAILAIFEHMYQTLQNPRFVIKHTALKDSVGYIHWAFHFDLNGQSTVLEGLSQVAFDAQGMVMEHLDFWDAGAEIYAKVPVLGWLVRWVANRLRVKV